MNSKLEQIISRISACILQLNADLLSHKSWENHLFTSITPLLLKLLPSPFPQFIIYLLGLSNLILTFQLFIDLAESAILIPGMLLIIRDRSIRSTTLMMIKRARRSHLIEVPLYPIKKIDFEKSRKSIAKSWMLMHSIIPDNWRKEGVNLLN